MPRSPEAQMPRCPDVHQSRTTLYLAVSHEKSDGSVVNVPIKRGKKRTSFQNDDLICQRLGFAAVSAFHLVTPKFDQFVPKSAACAAQYENMINGDAVTFDAFNPFEDCLGSVRKNGQGKYSTKYIKCVNEFVYIREMTPLVQNTLLSDNVQLFQNWELSFDIQVNSILSDWSSIVHFTNGEDNRRMPGVWFWGGSYKLNIVSTQSCDPAGDMGSLHSLGDYDPKWEDQAPGTINNVRIVHYGAGILGAYTRLWIDGVLVVESSDWTDSCDTGTVNLWAADPWYPAADASIGNLIYKEVLREVPSSMDS